MTTVKNPNLGPMCIETVVALTVLMISFLVGGLYLLSEGSTENSEALAAANQLYSTGNFPKAAELYEQLIEQGVVEPTLYYNLGNTYYMQGDLGRAVLNYQRAARLDPRDEDIKHNLAIARTETSNGSIVEEIGPIKSLSSLTSRWLTLNETALLTVGLWFAITILFLVFQQLQNSKLRSTVQYMIILGLLLLVATGTSLGSRMYIDRTQPAAVIIAPTVTLNINPDLDSSTDMTLISGEEVKISDVQGDWVQLSKYGSELKGWIPLDSVEFISYDVRGLQPTL